MKLADIDILRTPCEVHVNEDGYFSVYLQGRAEEERALVSDNTMLGAVEKAKPVIRERRTRVAVSFYEVSSLKRRTAVGFHAGTGNILLDDGAQIARYGRNTGLRDDMPEEKRTELETLREEVRQREKRVRDIESEYALQIEQAVQAAIDEAQG